MATVLDAIIAHKYEEVLSRKQTLPQTELERHLIPLDIPSFENALRPTSQKPKAFILEVKPASPSGGELAPELDLEKTLSVYNRFASGISVLTDKKYFKGSLELLKTIATQSDRPLLCKDFIVDPYQVLEARIAGAHAVLLIVKVLSDAQLQSLHQDILDLGMTPVVEIQNEPELVRALKLNPKVLLINNRDLSSFQIDFKTTETLSALIPPNILRISASGIEKGYDIQQLAPYCDAFLIGSILMRTPIEELPQKLTELTELAYT